MTPGEKIRKLRMSLGLTQEEVALRADLARSFISQVETDKTSPTVDNLERILKAVGSNLQSFFSDYKHEKIVYRKDERVPVYDEPRGIKSQLLMDAVEHKKVDAIITTLKAGARTDEEDYHSGDEFGYIISGNVVLVLDGENYELNKEDCFYYKADKKHFIMNNSMKMAKILWIKID